MKILFITDNFPPEVNAPAFRTFENCRYWVKLGAKVEVVTSCPNFPQGKLYQGYRNKIIQKEMFQVLMDRINGEKFVVLIIMDYIGTLESSQNSWICNQ